MRRLHRLGKRSSSEQLISTAENAILSHPQYEIIKQALVEGIPVREIVEWFAGQGWLTVSDRTFTDYLMAFKRGKGSKLVHGGADELDNLISANRPNVDVLVELNRALRLQKTRLKIDVGHELEMGKLFTSTVKEIEEYRNILELIAKIQGKLNGGEATTVTMDSGAREAYRLMQEDEEARDRVYHIVGSALKNEIKPNKKIKVKA